MKKLAMILVIVLMAVSLSIAAPALAEEGKSILFAPIYQGPYMIRAYEFFKEYAEPLGYTVDLQGPVDIDPSALVNTLTDCLSKDYDIVVTTSSDPASLVPILKQYRDNGTVVVTWDLDVEDPTARDAYAGLMDLGDTGDAVVDRMVEGMGSADFEWAIITGSLTSTFVSQRMDRMIAIAEEKYPDLKLVSTESSQGDTTRAFQIAQNILTAHPDVKVIVPNVVENAVPICQAIEQAGKTGEVFVYGLGTPSSLASYFEEGIVKEIVMWDPGAWGKWAAEVAIAIYEGKTFEEGPLGDAFPDFPESFKDVNEQYMYNVPHIFTLDNYADFEW